MLLALPHVLQPGLEVLPAVQWQHALLCAGHGHQRVRSDFPAAAAALGMLQSSLLSV